MRRRSRVPQPTTAARGQTGIDFMVGMGVFLLAVGFVFGFAPGLFVPFSGETGAAMVIADRGAETLSEDILVESMDQPGVLNETCTVEFFDEDGNVGDCRFDTENLNDATGIDDRFDLNVTIEEGGSIVSLQGVTLAAGDGSDPVRDTIVVKRVVLLAGAERTLLMRVW